MDWGWWWDQLSLVRQGPIRHDWTEEQGLNCGKVLGKTNFWHQETQNKTIKMLKTNQNDKTHKTWSKGNSRTETSTGFAGPRWTSKNPGSRFIDLRSNALRWFITLIQIFNVFAKVLPFSNLQAVKLQEISPFLGTFVHTVDNLE